MKTPIKELEILEKAKAKLLEKGEININPPVYTIEKGEINVNSSVYILEIHASDWHEIFKTDEMNDIKKNGHH